VANGIQWQRVWNENNNSRLRLNSSGVSSDANAPNAWDATTNYKTTTTTISIDHEFNTNWGNLTTLLEKKYDQFKADANIFNDSVDGSRQQLAEGLGYNLHAGGHILNASVRSDDYSNFSRRNSYSLAYGFEILTNWVLSARQSTGFKSPNLEQTYGGYGTTSLLPESNIADEISVQFEQGESKARVSVFENKITNLISSSASQKNCVAGAITGFCYYNVGQVKIQGVSLSGQSKHNDLNIQASLDLLDPVDEVKHKQLSLRSKQNFRMAVDKSYADTVIGIEYQYFGKRFDDAANLFEFPAYKLVNVWTKTKLSSDWSWLNRIDNLFDQKYQQFGCTNGGVNSCNYAMPGVTLFTAIQWQPK
jgi:vitamin B12 transporter